MTRFPYQAAPLQEVILQSHISKQVAWRFPFPVQQINKVEKHQVEEMSCLPHRVSPRGKTKRGQLKNSKDTNLEAFKK